jgi:iron complex outermembrane receptor protein
MKQFNKTAIALAVAQTVLMSSGAVMAQSAPAGEPAVVVVTGQRAALTSAQKIKQNADEVVDSIVADDIGKMPDRSVTEVLQRIVGVTIDRTMAKGDPEHYSVEGSGVTIRGLSYVRSELNGRDSFSANGGRALNFEDVPPELMAGVDVYKNPSAEQVEGSIGGLVNLRTAMPFDYKGFKGALSADSTYSVLKKKKSPSGSALLSNRWKTGLGEFGALVDLAYSESGNRTDAFQVEPYYPRTDIVNGKTVWIPKGAQYRTLEFDRKREGAYAALQWKRDQNLSSSLTYFKSKYQMQWDENAIFSGASAYNIRASADSTYDANGALLSGLLSDPADGGINFGGDTRTSNRKSSTTDIAWNLRWKPAPDWTVTTDLQHIKANTGSFDSTVATGILMPKEHIDLRGDVPVITFDAADRAYLADPKNYYWAFTMEHQDAAVAEGKAWKTDVKYDFDHPVLQDIRFGVRLTERDALTRNSNPGYNWAAISQPWQLGWNISKLASLGDPRFSGNTYVHDFKNFFNKDMAVPSLVFPNLALATGYPTTYAALHKYHDILCAEQAAAQGWGSCDAWKPATFGTDPSGDNNQSEKTGAFFTQMRFGFDNWRFPVDGNVGVRYVKTEMKAFGYTVFTPNTPNVAPGGQVVGPRWANIPAFAKAQDYEHSYKNVLPSLNLRMKMDDKLQFRFGFASALSRPDFTNLQGYTSLSQKVDATTNTDTGVITVNRVDMTGESKGNPYLKPVTSKQVDLTAEYYFSPVGSVTLAVFNKQLKDIIINQSFIYQIPDATGGMQDFTVTGPVNGARGKARGFELAYQQTFDKLPGWMSGLGMQANFTFVDSSTKLYKPIFQAYCTGAGGAANLNLNLNGCDTNGQTFGDLPLQGLSRRSYNLALFYEKDKLSTRLAYSWRSKNLQAVNANGTNGGDGLDTNPASSTFGQRNVAWALPTWVDDYGQLDASVFYNISENLTFGLEAQNLTDSKYRQLMQQHIGMKGRAWFVSGPRYTAKLRYTF